MLIEIAGRWIRRFTQIQEVAGAEEGLVTSKHRFGEGASLIDPSLNELLEPNKRVCGRRVRVQRYRRNAAAVASRLRSDP